MAGSGRVPGKEAGSGCLCLFLMWRREDSGPGTGLWSATKRERERGGSHAREPSTATVSLIRVQREVQVATFIAGSSWQTEVRLR